ncbi:MAG: mechanosensitive ion channel family protein [Candidatus Altiarchaeota archaeon]|nr:mechanosensitive ion channel family protein [Candidatus Altiarchaeota archaeon]
MDLSDIFPDTTFDLRELTLAAIIVVTTFIVAKFVRRILDRSFNKSSELLQVDPTRYNFLKHLISAVIYTVGLGIAIYSIKDLRTLSLSIFAGAGVIAVIIGFASQQAFSNVVSGLFISIFQPFRVGDRIKIKEDISGIVEDINLRHTVIKTFENKRIVIPNSIIGNEVIENAQLGDERICKFVEFGISYDSDIDKAMNIMKDEAIKHPDFLDKRTTEEKIKGHEPVSVKVIGFGDSSVKLRAYVWTPDPAAAFRLGCDLNKNIKERFDKEGVEIPFPYRTIVFKKDVDEGKPR